MTKIKEIEMAIQALNACNEELSGIDDTLDELERAGGDAPHRSVKRTDRIKVLCRAAREPEKKYPEPVFPAYPIIRKFFPHAVILANTPHSTGCQKIVTRIGDSFDNAMVEHLETIAKVVLYSHEMKGPRLQIAGFVERNGRMITEQDEIQLIFDCGEMIRFEEGDRTNSYPRLVSYVGFN